MTTSRILSLLGSGASWAALDTETTGLGPYDVVVEVALVGGDGSLLFESLVAPARPVTAKATAVHGLSARHFVDAPSWPTLWPSLQRLLRRHTLVAWNAAFDFRLLRQTCDRHDLPFQAPKGLCLRAAFKEIHPHIRGSLNAACLTLGCPNRPNHRARRDAEVARWITQELIRRSEEDVPASSRHPTE